MSDAEVDEYLSAHGTSISGMSCGLKWFASQLWRRVAVRKELDKHGLYKDTVNKRTGLLERRYRKQISISATRKPFIHFPK